MAWPESGNYEVRVPGTTTVKAAWGDAIDAAFNGVYGASRTIRGVQLSATAYTAKATPATPKIAAYGDHLAFEADVGKKFTFNRNVEVTGKVQSTSDVSIVGVGVFTRNDSTLDYGSGAVTEQEFYGTSKLFGQRLQASATTTDAATTVTPITYPVSNDYVYQIITLVTAAKNNFAEALMAMTADTFRRTGGATTLVASKTIYTATDEIGVTSYGWNLSGANLVYQIQGKAATTIRWNVKAELSIIG